MAEKDKSSRTKQAAADGDPDYVGPVDPLPGGNIEAALEGRAGADQPFQEALRALFQAHQQLWMDAQRDINDAWQTLTSAQREPVEEAQKASFEAYQRYVDAVNAAQGQNNAAQLIQTAWDELVKGQTDPWNDVQKRWTDAASAHTETLRTVNDRMQDSVRRAYGEFVAAHSRALGGVDTENPDPCLLVAASQHLTTAACWVADNVQARQNREEQKAA
jgi:hypothetical protein